MTRRSSKEVREMDEYPRPTLKDIRDALIAVGLILLLGACMIIAVAPPQ